MNDSKVNGSNVIISSISTQNGNDKREKQSTKLMKLFVDELREIYWAEHALSTAIPGMIENASSDDLIEVLAIHSSETELQIIRLEQVFDILGKVATAKKCESMEVLLKEAWHLIEECEEGAMRDAGIISSAQKIEHYEIAAYGTLRQLAEALDLDSAVDLLRMTLNTEIAADEIFSEAAISAINVLRSEERWLNYSHEIPTSCRTPLPFEQASSTHDHSWIPYGK